MNIGIRQVGISITSVIERPGIDLQYALNVCAAKVFKTSLPVMLYSNDSAIYRELVNRQITNHSCNKSPLDPRQAHAVIWIKQGVGEEISQLDNVLLSTTTYFCSITTGIWSHWLYPGSPTNIFPSLSKILASLKKNKYITSSFTGIRGVQATFWGAAAHLAYRMKRPDLMDQYFMNMRDQLVITGNLAAYSSIVIVTAIRGN